MLQYGCPRSSRSADKSAASMLKLQVRPILLPRVSEKSLAYSQKRVHGDQGQQTINAYQNYIKNCMKLLWRTNGNRWFSESRRVRHRMRFAWCRKFFGNKLSEATSEPNQKSYAESRSFAIISMTCPLRTSKRNWFYSFDCKWLKIREKTSWIKKV